MLADVEIREEPISTLHEHGGISIAFDTTYILQLTSLDNGLGGFCLHQQQLERPKRKDYDVLGGGSPANWAKRFDISRWALIVARWKGQRVGGAVIASDSPDVCLLEGRSDLALLWDIRVEPNSRGRGIGSALFRAAESWAVGKGYKHLKVETQNTNPEACRFYAQQGCVLRGFNRFAYPELPEEIQLLWYKDLGCVRSAG